MDRLTARDWYIETAASMEQIIGPALSTIVGIISPLLNLILHPAISAAVQGTMGAVGLIGIALGATVIGSLSDRWGYLRLFRLCPILIILGSIIAAWSPEPWSISLGMFIAGVGVGGGYPLDSAYISELMPPKQRVFMVGVAKTMCAIGFILPTLATLIILRVYPSPNAWRWIVYLMGGLGFITLLMRLHWAESPAWLINKGLNDKALKAASTFFGKNNATQYLIGLQNQPNTRSTDCAPNKLPKHSFFKGKNLVRIIYSGIPWACEGLGVYGIGIFLPLLIMSLGLDRSHAEGLSKIINSVEVTAVVNCSILPGFVLGLFVVSRLNHRLMLYGGFIGSAASMALLLAAYLLHWPDWVALAAFIIFEVFLNAGPHLVTYIIPAEIFPVEMRGTGSGIADFLGKFGAILGVFFMPLLLKAGGIALVITVTICVMLVGALIAIIFGRKVYDSDNTLKNQNNIQTETSEKKSNI